MGWTATRSGLRWHEDEQLGAVAGGPPILLKAPLAELILNAEMESVMWSPTKRNFPAVSEASPIGVVPVGKREPATGLRAPVMLSTWNAETVLAFRLFT